MMICKICGEEYKDEGDEGDICENCLVSVIRTDKIFPNEEDFT
jgi:hypothetical protein